MSGLNTPRPAECCSAKPDVSRRSLHRLVGISGPTLPLPRALPPHKRLNKLNQGVEVTRISVLEGLLVFQLDVRKADRQRAAK